MVRVLKKDGVIILGTDLNHRPTKTEPQTIKENEIVEWLIKSNIKIVYQNIEKETYNFKKGKKICLRGIKK